MNNYWKDRMAKAQVNKYNKNRRDMDKMIRKYYQSLSRQIIEDFESTYDKVLATTWAGKQPVPADLYKLNKYWETQKQLDQRLTRLGRKQIIALTKGFKTQFYDTYNVIKLDGLKAFSTIDDAAVQQIINSVWCADGKSWSKRVWENLAQLKDTLNEQLIHCVVTGKKTTQLKELLQERFNVSYNRADTIVRTEIAHIQTEAAKQRYKDYGIQQVQWWTDPDERTCPECGKLHKKIYPVGANIQCPAHPRCRCTLIPVVDIPQTNNNE